MVTIASEAGIIAKMASIDSRGVNPKIENKITQIKHKRNIQRNREIDFLRPKVIANVRRPCLKSFSISRKLLAIRIELIKRSEGIAGISISGERVCDQTKEEIRVIAKPMAKPEAKSPKGVRESGIGPAE